MVFLKSRYLVLSVSITLFLVMMMNIVLAGPTGLSLKLIHRDSPESPLYSGRNLTQLERMERSFQRTKARRQQMIAASMNSSVRSDDNSISPNWLSLPVSFDHIEFEYIVELGLGTIPEPSPPHTEVTYTYNSYYFLFDTESDLLWLQCEECTDCFPQDEPLFPWKKSTTYRPLLCDENTPCPYELQYADGSNTTGIYAIETLIVEDNGHIEDIENIFFGCGFKQLNFDFGGNDKGENPIAGILGLGGGEDSILHQFKMRRLEKKFEYCLVLWTEETNPTSTFIRFGSDTKIGGGGGGGQVIQTTPLKRYRGDTFYFANMFDISVGGTRIGYHDGEFDVDHRGNGGCLFDSGTTWTLLSTKVYEPLKAQLIQYFTDLDLHTHDPPEVWRYRYKLCFERPNGFNNFPKITFHFKVPEELKTVTESADLEIEAEAAFLIEKDFFCFNMFQSDNDRALLSVIIGAIQQTNQRILFDVENMKISWSKENCDADS